MLSWRLSSICCSKIRQAKLNTEKAQSEEILSSWHRWVWFKFEFFRIFFNFHSDNCENIGKINIMINCKQEPEIVNFILKMCCNGSDGYRGRKVYKIVKNLFIEAGDVEASRESEEPSEKLSRIFPKTTNVERQVLHAGTLALLLQDDGSISTKFRIIAKKMLMLHDVPQIVVGRVVKGLDVLTAVESRFGSRFGLPKREIFIKNCGSMKWRN